MWEVYLLRNQDLWYLRNNLFLSFLIWNINVCDTIYNMWTRDILIIRKEYVIVTLTVSNIIYVQCNSELMYLRGEGGPTPFFPMEKMGKKVYGREGNEYFPFFSHFALWGKWEKTHFSHGQKWGWTPPI